MPRPARRPLQVLQSTRQLRMWGSDQPEATYYDLIAKDPDVVKVVLLLTGSLEGMKAATTDFLGGWAGVGWGGIERVMGEWGGIC